MEESAKPLWVVHKLIRADSMQDAMAQDAKGGGEIVEVTKVSLEKEKLSPAIGFTLPGAEARLLAGEE